MIAYFLELEGQDITLELIDKNLPVARFGRMGTDLENSDYKH